MNLSVGRVRAGIAHFLLAFVVAAALVAPAFGQEPQRVRKRHAASERRAGAADYTAATLIARRDKVLNAWLTAVNPIVDPRLAPDGTFSFDNAAASAGVAAPPARYELTWSRFDNTTAKNAGDSVQMSMRSAPSQAPSAILHESEYVAVAVRTKLGYRIDRMFPRPHRADRSVCPPDSSFPVRLPTMPLSMIVSTRVFPFGSSLTVAMLIFSVQAVAQTSEQAVTEPTSISQPAPSEVSSSSTPAPAGVFHPALTLPAAPSFGHLFSDTVKDFRQMASRDTFTWLSIGGAAALAARSDDSRLSQQLSGAAGLSGTFRPGQTIGSAPFQLAGALAAYSLGRAAGSSKTAWLGADLFRAQILVQTVTQVAKMSVGRTRPDGSDSFSFPSGHTSSTFASATVLQHYYGWKAGIPAYAVASYVAASRIQMKRHYLSDVAFGAALGIAAGRSVTIGGGRAKFALTPVAAPSGGGVGFTWVGQR